LVGSVDERVRNAKKSFSKKVPKSNLATRCWKKQIQRVCIAVTTAEWRSSCLGQT
jgi:hypothetical protein